MRLFTNIRIKRAHRVLHRAALLAALTAAFLMAAGCSPLKPSEETLQMQLGETPDHQPVLLDVYGTGTSVEADVYDAASLRLP